MPLFKSMYTFGPQTWKVKIVALKKKAAQNQ